MIRFLRRLSVVMLVALFASVESAVAFSVTLRKTTETPISLLTLAPNGQYGYAIVITNYSPWTGEIIELRLSDLAITRRLTLRSDDGVAGVPDGLAVDKNGEFLYALTKRAINIDTWEFHSFVKVRLSDLQIVQETPMPPGTWGRPSREVVQAEIDPSNTHYRALHSGWQNDNPSASFLIVRLSDLSFQGTGIGQSSYGMAVSSAQDAVFVNRRVAYDIDVDELIRITLPDLSKTKISGKFGAPVAVPGEELLYVGVENADNTVHSLRTVRMTDLSTQDERPVGHSVRQPWIRPNGKTLYFIDPGTTKLVKIHLPDFAETVIDMGQPYDQLVMEAGGNTLYAYNHGMLFSKNYGLAKFDIREDEDTTNPPPLPPTTDNNAPEAVAELTLPDVIYLDKELNLIIAAALPAGATGLRLTFTPIAEARDAVHAASVRIMALESTVLHTSELDLAPGRYHVEVVAVNAAGQASAPKQKQIRISASSHALVGPNPWNAREHAGIDIVFRSLAPGSSVKLFTISGQWVKTLPEDNSEAHWNLTNSSGERVASGIYFYLATGSDGERSRGTVVIIK